MEENGPGFCPEMPTMSRILGRPLRDTIMTERDWEAIYERYAAHVRECMNHPCTERRR